MGVSGARGLKDRTCTRRASNHLTRFHPISRIAHFLRDGRFARPIQVEISKHVRGYQNRG